MTGGSFIVASAEMIIKRTDAEGDHILTPFGEFIQFCKAYLLAPSYGQLVIGSPVTVVGYIVLNYPGFPFRKLFCQVFIEIPVIGCLEMKDISRVRIDRGKDTVYRKLQQA